MKKTMRLHTILLASSTLVQVGFAFVPIGDGDPRKEQQASQNEFAVNQSRLMNNLLHEAAAAGKIETVRDLIERGASINSRDENAWTPLMQATQGNHLAVVKVLLDAGADINAEIGHCKICKDCYGYYDEEYAPSWRGPRRHKTPPTHDCKKYLTAPSLAQRQKHHEIAALFEKYKKGQCEETSDNVTKELIEQERIVKYIEHNQQYAQIALLQTYDRT
jgi:ankyrin repeat protein